MTIPVSRLILLVGAAVLQGCAVSTDSSLPKHHPHSSRIAAISLTQPSYLALPEQLLEARIESIQAIGDSTLRLLLHDRAIPGCAGWFVVDIVVREVHANHASLALASATQLDVKPQYCVRDCVLTNASQPTLLYLPGEAPSTSLNGAIKLHDMGLRRDTEWIKEAQPFVLGLRLEKSPLHDSSIIADLYHCDQTATPVKIAEASVVDHLRLSYCSDGKSLFLALTGENTLDVLTVMQFSESGQSSVACTIRDVSGPIALAVRDSAPIIAWWSSDGYVNYVDGGMQEVLPGCGHPGGIACAVEGSVSMIATVGEGAMTIWNRRAGEWLTAKFDDPKLGRRINIVSLSGRWLCISKADDRVYVIPALLE